MSRKASLLGSSDVSLILSAASLRIAEGEIYSFLVVLTGLVKEKFYLPGFDNFHDRHEEYGFLDWCGILQGRKNGETNYALLVRIDEFFLRANYTAVFINIRILSNYDRVFCFSVKTNVQNFIKFLKIHLDDLSCRLLVWYKRIILP